MNHRVMSVVSLLASILMFLGGMFLSGYTQGIEIRLYEALNALALGMICVGFTFGIFSCGWIIRVYQRDWL